MGISAYYKDDLPDPHTYDVSQLTPPRQTPTARAPFALYVNKEHYVITPKFDYELTGMVVSYNDSNGLTDIWHHDIWKDFINVRDVCVIWEPNVSSGVYKNIAFSSDSWTCWAFWPDSATSSTFKFDGLSNNHILTDDNSIKAALQTAEKGDVVHFKGVLADYRNEASSFTRGTSTVRTDTGNGACETVYIDEFKVVKKANSSLRTVYSISKWLAILFFIGFAYMFFITPHKIS